MTGIVGAGVYAPRYRVEADEIGDAWGRFAAAGIQTTAVPAADEDALTMADEAARRALAAAGVDAADVSLLAFATSTPPVEEEDLTTRLGEFLGVPATATRRYHGGSTRAGTEALRAATESDDAPALVVAADCPRGEPNSPEEHAAGAGAAAFVLAGDGDTELAEVASYAADYPGTRFREAGSREVDGLEITQYDRQAYIETVGGAVDALDADPDPEFVAVTAPDGGLPYRAAGALGVDNDAISEVATVHELGDTGAASALISLATAFEKGAADVLCVGYGSGSGADALAFSGTAPPVESDTGGAETVDYPAYLRLRGDVVGDPPAGGAAKVSVPSWRRTRAARYRLEAGRCPECGALAFPAEGACPSCHGLVDYEAVELPREGVVETVTTVGSGGAPPEFAVQTAKGGDYAVAIVGFDVGGERVSAPMQTTDRDPESVGVGDTVEAVVRRIYTQEGVTRYGTKVK